MTLIKIIINEVRDHPILHAAVGFSMVVGTHCKVDYMIICNKKNACNNNNVSIALSDVNLTFT